MPTRPPLPPLSPRPRPAPRDPETPAADPLTIDEMKQEPLGAQDGRELWDLDNDLRNVRAELAERSFELAALRSELEETRTALHNERQRLVVCHAFAQALTRSFPWKLLAPLRLLRRLVAPRGFDARALIPWQQLEAIPNEPGAWRATGPEPQFIVPCWLPAGWLRLQIHLASTVPGRLEVCTDRGDGFPAGDCLEYAEYDGRYNRDFFVWLPREVYGLRFSPLNGEEEVRWLALRVRPVSRGVVLLRLALRGKLRQMQGWGPLAAAFGSGLRLLLLGRLSDVQASLLAGGNGLLGSLGGGVGAEVRYESWRRDGPWTGADLERLRAEAAALCRSAPPLFSVLLPIDNVTEGDLRLTIDSVLRQVYPGWELCIADDGSTAPQVRTILERVAERDTRVKVAFCPRSGGPAAARDAAFALAQGEYVALLDPGAELAEAALLRVAQAIVRDRGVDLLYSDEDQIDAQNRYVQPFFKPDWSPRYFLTCMDGCGLSVVRTTLLRRLGGFRGARMAPRAYESTLKQVAGAARIQHLRDVLYHWRQRDRAAGGSN